MENRESNSLEQLRKLVLQQLSQVGVRQGESKPGDGTYSALLSKPTPRY